MVTPFANDIFALIWKAFKNLYPDKECECFWEPQIREDENGNEVFGLTDFGEDGSVVVSFVSTENAPFKVSKRYSFFVVSNTKHS